MYITGGFAGTSSFGSTALSGFGVVDNIFLAKLTDAGSTGSFAWALPVGGVYVQQALGVAIGVGGRVYVGGGLVPSATFGTLSIPGVGSGGVAFLASVTDATLTATASALRPETIGLFPNPAHGRATVQVPAMAGSPAILTLLDALGRTLRTQPVASSTADLDLTGLAPGLYAVRAQAGSQVATHRLVVE